MKLLSSVLNLDGKILVFIQQHRQKFLNHFFIFLTYSGMGRAWFIVAIIFNALNITGVSFVESQAVFLRSFFAPLLAWILSSMVKKFFSRQRPENSNFNLSPLVQTPTCGSFPSAHAASSFAFFFALMLTAHPLAPAIGFWAMLVSFSRMYLGVHYFTDIVGGIALGFLSGALVIFSSRSFGM